MFTTVREKPGKKRVKYESDSVQVQNKAKFAGIQEFQPIQLETILDFIQSCNSIY